MDHGLPDAYLSFYSLGQEGSFLKENRNNPVISHSFLPDTHDIGSGILGYVVISVTR